MIVKIHDKKTQMVDTILKMKEISVGRHLNLKATHPLRDKITAYQKQRIKSISRG
jgi:hypothetical protein